MANPNPSPETRFGGENGNPSNGGKTSEQRKMEYEAAEMAASLRHKMLSSMMEKVESPAEGSITPLEVLKLLDANTLKLFKDSEDRAHGTPKATNEHSGPDGGPIKTQEVSAIDELRDKIEAIAGRKAGEPTES